MGFIAYLMTTCITKMSHPVNNNWLSKLKCKKQNSGSYKNARIFYFFYP
jgi:hypothetical protein